MNKYLKYTLRTLGVLIAIITIAFIGISIYVSSYKTKLIAEATEKIGETIGGKISIEDMGVSLFQNFPYISISINNIKVTDTLFEIHKHPLVQAEKIFVRINPLKLIILDISVNKITVKNAAFYIYTDTSGYTNAYLLKGNNKPKTNQSAQAGVRLRNGISRTGVKKNNRPSAFASREVFIKSMM